MSSSHRSAVALQPAAKDAGEEGAREFIFSDVDFRNLSQLAYQHAGIVLGESKRNLVYSRLSRRLRALGLSAFREYREHLGRDETEIERFINSISTNHTKFFREDHHFDHLREQIAAPYARAAQQGGRRLRIWSAGCSSGEEPYTIALVLEREVPAIERCDARILATDIDTDVLTKAAKGEYPASALEEIPRPYRSFLEERTSGVVMNQDVRALIAFKHLNLMGGWPFRGKFDAIFCRNVMIYFDGPTKSKLIDRYAEALIPGGWLYIGHSESLIGSHPGLQSVGRTIYRRTS
jgi:chemotaxis protein methyltransferase CheR